MKKSTMEQREEALSRARNGQSFSNYPAIISGFMEKGIPEGEIRPRENVFTFAAWKAQGRSVKRGEHGVKVFTYVANKVEKEQADGSKKEVTLRRPLRTTVFHVSQTEERS